MNVAITGTGIVSSLGNSVSEMFENLILNKTGIKALPDWQRYNGLYSYVGAPAHQYDEKQIPRTTRRSMSRMSEMATIATFQAISQSGLPLEKSNSRGLIILGSTSGSPETLEAYFTKLIEKGGPEGQLSTSFFKVMNHSVAANVALALGFNGPVLAPSSACSTSTQAIILGWELIQTGLYDFVIAGGADELHFTSTSIFDIVLAASRSFNDAPENASRPFDKNRDGLVVSEGAGILVLESEAFARKRNAPILGLIGGGAYLCDGEHMAHPQAESMFSTMRLALDRCQVSPEQIDYVSAHATGTVVGDTQEALATGKIIGKDVPVSSLKGHFGHALAACGAIEIIASMEMIRRNLVIPTRNLNEIDENCSTIFLPKTILQKKLTRVLCNNFAFGGMNSSLVLCSP